MTILMFPAGSNLKLLSTKGFRVSLLSLSVFSGLVFFVQINSAYASEKIRLNLASEAVAAYKRADYSSAAELSNKILQIDRSNKTALYMRAICYKQTGKVKAAASELESYLKLAPDDLNAKIALAQCWIEEGQLSRAVELLEKLDKLYPNNPELVFSLAYAYASYGDLIGWDVTARRALSLAPAKEDRYKLLIGAQLSHFDYRQAEESANKYLRQFPQVPGPYRVLFEDFYIAQERSAEAAKLFHQQEYYKAFDASNYFAMAKIFAGLATRTYGNEQALLNSRIWLDLSEQCYKHALALEPENLPGNLEFATLLALQSKYREAAPFVKKVLTVAPSDPLALSLYKRVLPGKKDMAGQLKSELRSLFKPKSTIPKPSMQQLNSKEK